MQQEVIKVGTGNEDRTLSPHKGVGSSEVYEIIFVAALSSEIGREESKMDVNFCLISILYYILTAQAQLFDVTISPQEDYNAAPRDDQNITVTFECTATIADILWRVNYTSPSQMIIASRGVTTTVPALTNGLFSTSLFIPANQDLGRTSIQCSAVNTDVDPPVVDHSKLVYLNIQRLLDAPPNLTLSEADEQLTRLLTWSAPQTLNITNVDPDIEFYQVCYNISAELTCTNVSSVGERQFKFSNVRVPLLFTVTAFNVVGEGNESSIVHQASNCENTGGLCMDLLVLTIIKNIG